MWICVLISWSKPQLLKADHECFCLGFLSRKSVNLLEPYDLLLPIKFSPCLKHAWSCQALWILGGTMTWTLARSKLPPFFSFYAKLRQIIALWGFEIVFRASTSRNTDKTDFSMNIGWLIHTQWGGYYPDKFTQKSEFAAPKCVHMWMSINTHFYIQNLYYE